MFSVVLGKAKTAYRKDNTIAKWEQVGWQDEVNLNQISIHNEIKPYVANQVEGLKEWERMKLIKKYVQHGVTFDYFIRDVDGTAHFYCLNSGGDCQLWGANRNGYDRVRDTKTSWYNGYYDQFGNTRLQQFLKDAAQVQWDFFWGKVNHHEGEADINAVGHYFASQAIPATESTEHFFKGRIGELIMFSNQLSDAEVTKIKDKLVEKWK